MILSPFQKSQWKVVALAGSEVVAPMPDELQLWGSSHQIQSPWCVSWTEHVAVVLEQRLTIDQLERIRAKSLGNNVLGSKFGLCCLKKCFLWKICDMIPVQYPKKIKKGKMVIKWSLLVWYEVLQSFHHVIICHVFKLSSFAAVSLQFS